MNPPDDDKTRRIPAPNRRVAGKGVRPKSNPQGVQPGGIKPVRSAKDDTSLFTHVETPALNPTTLHIRHNSERAPQHQAFAPGRLIKQRFSLVEEIGYGGMGVVYSARDLRKEEAGDNDSLIAIKLLSPEFKEHPAALSMLQQESKKSQLLAHPNIVTVYDFDRDDDTVYMIMELLRGRALRDYMDEIWGTNTPLEEVLPIIQGMVYALDYAHEQGIVHSDLKPANVFLTDHHGIKVLDFGIARAIRNSEREQTQTSKKLGNPTEGLVVLTPSYASPEMFDEQPPDPRDDIYALACIAYQLLSGRHPYYNRPANKAIEEGLVPKQIEGLNDRQWKGLLRGLSLERETRTPSAGEFLQAFLPKKREPWKLAALGIGLSLLFYVSYITLKPPVVPDWFTNPLTEATISQDQQIEVDNLLEAADVHLLVGRLDAALLTYQEVLNEKQPWNRRAIGGLRSTLDGLTVLARQQLSVDDFESARRTLEAGLGVYPHHAGLLAVREQLDTDK